MTVEIRVSGMTCQGCVRSLGRVLEREGLASAIVELGTVRIADPEDLARAEAAIAKAGFTAMPPHPSDPPAR